jgi:hypothetical protein
MTIHAVRSHSLAQLKLLQRAATRLSAQDGLIALDTYLVAASAAWTGKDSDVKKLRQALQEQANGK